MPIKFDNSCHWYSCRDQAPSPQHDADLRVARKCNLYPSVTTIIKDEFKNDFLERWKTNELLVAAAGTFKQPHENDDQYCQRIYDLSMEKATTAANFGKELHDAIEHYPQLPLNTSLSGWIDRFGGWYELNVERPIRREAILYDHDLGVAGRCDFIGQGKGQFEGKRILPDWKTQGVKRDDKGRKKPMFYESWPRQLAFYAVCDAKETGTFPQEIPVCISVILDSTEPDEPFIKVWSQEEILSAYEDFTLAAYRWFKRKKYWPAAHGQFKITPSIQMPQ